MLSEGNAHRRTVLRISQRSHFQLRDERFTRRKGGAVGCRQVTEEEHLKSADFIQHIAKVVADHDYMVMGKEEFHPLSGKSLGQFVPSQLHPNKAQH